MEAGIKLDNKIYTGYISQTKKYREVGLMPIVIARWLPPMINIFDPHIPREHQHWLGLAPFENLLRSIKNKLITWDQYKVIYITDLNDKFKDKTKVAIALNKCANTYGADLVLMCYEKDPNQCHRSLFADWLNEILEDESKICEYKF